MRELGIESVRQKAKKNFQKELYAQSNQLHQDFHAEAPNCIWVSNTTEFWYNQKRFVFCVIIDLFSRKIVAHKISFKNSTRLVKATFESAYEVRKPPAGLIFHSDRGSNYTSQTFCNLLASQNIAQSFSRSGKPHDNAVAETFFKSLKQEELYRTHYHSEKEFKKAVDTYILFYNSKRPHKTLQYKTPDQVEIEFAENWTNRFRSSRFIPYFSFLQIFRILSNLILSNFKKK